MLLAERGWRTEKRPPCMSCAPRQTERGGVRFARVRRKRPSEVRARKRPRASAVWTARGDVCDAFLAGVFPPGFEGWGVCFRSRTVREAQDDAHRDRAENDTPRFHHYRRRAISRGAVSFSDLVVRDTRLHQKNRVLADTRDFLGATHRGSSGGTPEAFEANQTREGARGRTGVGRTEGW